MNYFQHLGMSLNCVPYISKCKENSQLKVGHGNLWSFLQPRKQAGQCELSAWVQEKNSIPAFSAYSKEVQRGQMYTKQQSLSNPPTALKHHIHLKNISGFQIDRKLRSIFFVPLQQFKDLPIHTLCKCCSIKLFRHHLATVKPERIKMGSPRNKFNRSTVKIVFEAINV